MITDESNDKSEGIFNLIKASAKQGYRFAEKLTEKSGDLLGSVTKAEKAQEKHVKPAEAQAQKTGGNASDNLFQQQLPQLGRRLLGRRFSKVVGVVSRVVPDALIHKTTNNVFMQVARLAEQWSLLDLPGGLSLRDIDTLSDIEREDLAKAVANQNRAMAAVGSGLTGLTGLIGTIADLLWLLLLSLRLIYQTAFIYGEKLTGVEGAKRAYSVLSLADLSMLTEKQAVLVSMGAASELVDDADLKVLQGLIDENNNIAFFQETVKNMAEQFNVDLNFSWLNKVLPLAAGVTSAVYSVYIINEISAVANAELSATQTKGAASMKLLKNEAS